MHRGRHRILKTGCGTGRSALRTAVRIKAAVTVNAAIAWRLAALTLMGRDTPELPARRMLSASGTAMLPVARLGGHLNRRNDRPPGHRTVRESQARLVVGAQTIERIAGNG